MSNYNIPVPTCQAMALAMVYMGKLYINAQYGLVASATTPVEVRMQPQMVRAVMMACTGAGNKRIASEMHLSTHTIRNYIVDALRLTRSMNRTEMAYKLMKGELSLVESVPRSVGRPSHADNEFAAHGNHQEQMDYDALAKLRDDLKTAIAQIEGQMA